MLPGAKWVLLPLKSNRTAFAKFGESDQDFPQPPAETINLLFFCISFQNELSLSDIPSGSHLKRRAYAAAVRCTACIEVAFKNSCSMIRPIQFSPNPDGERILNKFLYTTQADSRFAKNARPTPACVRHGTSLYLENQGTLMK